MALPSDNEALQSHYRERLASLDGEHKVVTARRQRLRMFFASCFALLVFLGTPFAPQSAPNWFVLVPIAAIAASIPIYLRLQAQLTRIKRLQVFHDTNLARVDGTKPQSGHTGEEFHVSSHLYDRDLNVLGPDSLFGLLATTRTGIGQGGLARFLLDPNTSQRSIERQECIQELTPLTTLREEIDLLGPSRFHQISHKLFDNWLEEPVPTFHPAISLVLVVTTLGWVTLVLIGLLHYATWSVLLPNIAAVFAIQAVVTAKVRERVLPILNASQIAMEIQLFSDGLQLLQQQSFTTPRLRALQQICREPSPASSLLKKIQNQFIVVEQRNKQFFFVFSLLIAAGTHAGIAIANWKRRYGPAMKQWAAAWAEFEALNALANYAFEHPQDVYPTLLADDAPPSFEAAALGHPLLPPAVCIRNDALLGAATRFYLISGSNMAGKSTLLRAIGLNAVLAYSGAPVCADSLSLTSLRIGASLALTDSLAESKSKFLAEVQRLHAILAVSKAEPALFLVDEIFSGTNSLDRSTAGKAVVESLLQHGAIGALSTHDLTLTSLATADNHGLNVHMASPDPDDPLAFDFRLKPGVNPSSNALAIIRMMGIET